MIQESVEASGERDSSMDFTDRRSAVSCLWNSYRTSGERYVNMNAVTLPSDPTVEV